MKSFKEYEDAAFRTMRRMDLTSREMVMGLSLGMSEEAGEVAGLIKKHIMHGHPLDRADVLKEIGDCLWYCSMLANELGYNLETVAKLNIEKLEKRYPNGFSTEASLNREAPMCRTCGFPLGSDTHSHVCVENP